MQTNHSPYSLLVLFSKNGQILLKHNTINNYYQMNNYKNISSSEKLNVYTYTSIIIILKFNIANKY